MEGAMNPYCNLQNRSSRDALEARPRKPEVAGECLPRVMQRGYAGTW